MNPNDTPTPTDACPHCGKPHVTEKPLVFRNEPAFQFECGTLISTFIRDRTELCIERKKSQKLEVEVERLREKLKQAIEIAHRYDEGWPDASDLFDTFIDNLDKFNQDNK